MSYTVVAHQVSPEGEAQLIVRVTHVCGHVEDHVTYVDGDPGLDVDEWEHDLCSACEEDENDRLRIERDGELCDCGYPEPHRVSDHSFDCDAWREAHGLVWDDTLGKAVPKC